MFILSLGVVTLTFFANRYGRLNKLSLVDQFVILHFFWRNNRKTTSHANKLKKDRQSSCFIFKINYFDEIPYSGSLVKYKAYRRGAKVVSKGYVNSTLVSRLQALCLTSEPEYGNSSIV